MAQTLRLTPWTVRGLVGDLRKTGMLSVKRGGKRHHYAVNLDASCRLLPTLGEMTLRTLLGRLVEEPPPSPQSSD